MLGIVELHVVMLGVIHAECQFFISQCGVFIIMLRVIMLNVVEFNVVAP